MKFLILSRDGLVVLALLLIILIASRIGALEPASLSLYDKIRTLGDAPVSKVLVVAIDEHTLAKNAAYPVSFETHLRLLENLISAGIQQAGYVGLHSLNRADPSSVATPPVYGQQLEALSTEIRSQRLVIAGIPFVGVSNNDLTQTTLPEYLLQDSLLPVDPLPDMPVPFSTTVTGKQFAACHCFLKLMDSWFRLLLCKCTCTQLV